MIDSVKLSADEWQTLPIIINPPALNHSAVMLMAELHGRMGRFPTVLRIRRIKDSVPTRYEIAEVAPLQEVRDMARRRRMKEEK